MTRYYILLFVFILQACTGTTGVIRYQDVDVATRNAPAVHNMLGNINVSSKVGSFNSDIELKNFKTALKKMIGRVNYFGSDKNHPYNVDVNIKKFGIGLASFGSFDSNLTVSYKLTSATGFVIFDGLIESIGADDSGSFMGMVRQNRSRTVAVAQNIGQFLTELLPQLVSYAKNHTAKTTTAYNALPTNNTGSTIELPIKELNSTPAGSQNFGRYYALIIGNDRYRFLPKLNTAGRDAKKLDSILREQYGFETKVLYNAQRKDIISQLTAYRRQLSSTDNLLVYYAGHGWLDKDADEGYWLPVDAEEDNPVNWISNATITSAIRAIPANHVLIVADSCFSGKLTRGIKPVIRTSDFVKRMAQKRSRTVFTSGGLEPVLDTGGNQGHSVFASALFQSLEDNSGVVDTAQIFSVVRRKVALSSDQTPEYSDIRKAGHDGGDFLFVRSR